MGLFKHNPFKKIEHAAKKGAGVILPAVGATVGFIYGGPAGAVAGAQIGSNLGGNEIAAAEAAKKSSGSSSTGSGGTETGVVTPTQGASGMVAKSDVGLGDVTSIFDEKKEEQDPFRSLLA